MGYMQLGAGHRRVCFLLQNFRSTNYLSGLNHSWLKISSNTNSWLLGHHQQVGRTDSSLPYRWASCFSVGSSRSATFTFNVRECVSRARSLYTKHVIGLLQPIWFLGYSSASQSFWSTMPSPHTIKAVCSSWKWCDDIIASYVWVWTHGWFSNSGKWLSVGGWDFQNVQELHTRAYPAGLTLLLPFEALLQDLLVAQDTLGSALWCSAEWMKWKCTCNPMRTLLGGVNM